MQQFIFLPAKKIFTSGDIIARVDSTATPAIGDSVYLDKIIFRDTNIATSFIDGTLWTFNYDPQKRLSLITFKSLVNLSDSGNLFKFYYNFNDTLPFKVDGPINISNGTAETYYFFYNNLGKLIKDSINNFQTSRENFSRIFSYSGNRIFAELNSSNSTLSNPIEKDTFTLDSRMNIVDFRYHKRTTANTFELASSTNNIYDNGINSYLKVPSMKMLFFSYSTINYEGNTSLYIGVNNIISNTYNGYPYTGSSSTYFQHISIKSNIYYQNGLLKKSNGSDYNNESYFYKAL